MKADIIDISRKHTDFRAFRWLVSALSKHPNEKRYHVIHLYAKDGLLVCTDGNRIHTYKSENGDYQDGYYIVILDSPERVFLVRNENINMEYPPTEKVLSKPNTEPFTVYADNDFECSNVFAHILRMFEKNHLHYNFLWDLLRFGHHFDCYVGRETDPVVFVKENMKAAIMPMAALEK